MRFILAHQIMEQSPEPKRGMMIFGQSLVNQAFVNWYSFGCDVKFAKKEQF